MKRTGLLALAALATAALLVPTGAFTPTGTDAVSDDLELRPAEGPNGDYAVINDDGELELLLTGANPSIEGEGVPANAVTPLSNVFVIQNTDSEAASVWVTDDAEDVQFYRGDDPDNSVEGSDNSVVVAGNSAVSIGLRIDTRGENDVADVSTFSVNAEPVSEEETEETPDDGDEETPDDGDEETPDDGDTGDDGDEETPDDGDDGDTGDAPPSDDDDDAGGGGGGGGSAPPAPPSDDEDDTESIEPIVLTPELQADGTVLSALFNVSEGQTVVVDITGAETDDDFLVAGLNVTDAEAASNVRVAVNQSASPSDGTPENAQARTNVGYVNVTLQNYNASNSTAGTFTFRLTEQQRDVLGTEPEAVQMYRYNGSWVPIETTYRGNGTFTAGTAGFSWFAVGVQQPTVEVTDANLSATAVETGEGTNLTVALANADSADGNVTLDVTAGNETVESRTVTVGANTTAVETFELAFDEAGSYDIAVDGTAAGTVTVTQPTTPTATEPTPTAPTPTATASPTAEATTESDAETTFLGGAGAMVFVIAIIVVAVVGLFAILRAEWE